MDDNTPHSTIGPWKKQPVSGSPAKLPAGAETMIDPAKPGAKIRHKRQNTIDADQLMPARVGLRYKLSPATLGKLERLAKSQFLISELSEEDLEDWSNLTPEAKGAIAQSVNASSEIEGEQIHLKELDIVVMERPTADFYGADDNSEDALRFRAFQSICGAYYWMLCSSHRPIITFELIMECHRRMFESTKPDMAGRIKSEDVSIRGGGYEIKTLPSEKTEAYLRHLTAEFSRKWEFSEKHADCSRFLITAEFIVDFLAIHPFEDGNGRTARLLSTYLLEKAGYHFARFYPVDTLIVETQRDYYDALYSSQKNWFKKEEDLSQWIEYYTNTIFEQWNRAYRRVREAHLRRQNRENVES